ncbi:MarR family winged helix-turn-helix transcriptional regulator [Salinarimonas soli]|uniref:MarR family transcriptional regulator n=1 Tax=Salinarimonas soli TaxID=1638099 RepID=A0A5B2UVJ2_9HYPH|nr:MarR family transcriptional regulator [Salinarimonas soli]KAA2230876.1 MarR family transcriptional regulator [Salinarimonas soli]
MADTNDLLRLDRQLCFTVYAAHHAFTAAYKAGLEPLGLTYPQYLVLLVLWEQEGLKVKEIGKRLHLDSGTLTPLLKRMEKGGLLRRLRDAADERQVRIELTEHGRHLQAEVLKVRQEIGCALGGAEEPIQDLRARLEGVIEQLSASGSARSL